MMYPENRKLHFKDSDGVWHFHGDLYSKGDKRVCSLQTVAKFMKELRALGNKEPKPKKVRQPIKTIITKEEQEKNVDYTYHHRIAKKLLGHDAPVGTTIIPKKPKKRKRRKINAG